MTDKKPPTKKHIIVDLVPASAADFASVSSAVIRSRRVDAKTSEDTPRKSLIRASAGWALDRPHKNLKRLLHVCHCALHPSCQV